MKGRILMGVVCGIFLVSSMAFSASKVGYVNLQKVFTGYKKAMESEAKEKIQEFTKKWSEVNKKLDNRRKEIEGKRLQEIEDAIKEYGKKHGYSVILDSRAILYGEDASDLTDEIINGGKIIGDENVIITGVSGIKEAEPGDLTFIATNKYKNLLKTTGASAVLVSPEINNTGKAVLIQVENPSLAFAKIMTLIGPEPIKFEPGIHPTAIIGQNVKLGKNVSVQPFAVIEDYAEIGDNTTIGACVYIGHYTKIGKDCLIYPHVVIRERIKIGDRVIIHPGTVIGGDGFGFATVKGVHHKIPQIGTVEIGNDVEIGSNVTIDRARFDKTYIGNGVKIDNLVQIAHNVKIGDNI